MDDEVEDIVGDVRYTDSQKSVTTSAAYSMDFTDSSPERHNSSGKETYILDQDESYDSESTFRLHMGESLNNLTETMSPKPDMQQRLYNEINKSIRANFKKHNLTHESTQTSKTIIELAKNEIIVVHKPTQSKSLETQTSYVSIKEHKTLKINIDCISNESEVTHDYNLKEDNMYDISPMFMPVAQSSHKNTNEDTNDVFTADVQDPSNNTQEQADAEDNTIADIQEPEQDTTIEIRSERSSEDKIIQFIDDESIEREDQKEANYETPSEFESSKYDSDIEEDSLMLESEYRSSRRSKGDNASETSEMQNSIDNDVEELYNKLSESPLLLSPENSMDPCTRKYGTLTPLTEETSQKRSFLDITTSLSQTIMEPTKDTDNGITIVNNAGVKVKMFTNSEITRGDDKFKLPLILTKSCPPSPHLNFLFSVNTNPLGKTGTLPSLLEGHDDGMFQSWEIDANQLASGESPLISGRSDPAKMPREPVHLPPIHVEGAIYHNANKPMSLVSPHIIPPLHGAISINDRIKELKTMTNNKTRSKPESRSVSPTSNSSPEEGRTCDVAERGCDNVCLDLLRRLRSTAWVEVLETLEDIPRSLEKFWSSLTVNRTAELLRQVTVHVDSPRTQVARSACTILAEILKNTNYTRKPVFDSSIPQSLKTKVFNECVLPIMTYGAETWILTDFYEAISMLLTKTGSFSRPVRRAANVALDNIACGVDVAHAAAAICIYGVGHKSGLVRCASARLLVVCCALAEGGRQILRTRPPSAAAARRHVLRALADLLQDKNIDTRKYAERLYTILRPLPTFEAYFLTDVDVELASRHMKKYDPLLIHNKRDSVASLSIFS